NGIFESSESVATLDNFGSGSPATFSITVPPSQAPGIYRLRVRLVYGMEPASAIEPCGNGGDNYYYGETHDYTVSICPVVNPTVTSSDPIYCGNTDGTITLSGLDASASYTV